MNKIQRNLTKIERKKNYILVNFHIAFLFWKGLLK